MPHSCLLHVPLCPLPVGVSRWPSPTRSQRARDQPLGYREGLESGGRRKMSSLGSRDVIFFFSRILINVVSLPVRNVAIF